MGVLGRPLSAEHRAKISAANKGRKIDRAVVERLAEQRRGKPLNLTDEQRQAMRDRRLGRRLSDETKAKISAANKGRKLTIMDRNLRSLKAIEQDRGARLNERVAADPELAARRRAGAIANLERVNAAAREERGLSMDDIKRQFWARTGTRKMILQRYAKGAS